MTKIWNWFGVSLKVLPVHRTERSIASEVAVFFARRPRPWRWLGAVSAAQQRVASRRAERLRARRARLARRLASRVVISGLLALLR